MNACIWNMPSGDAAVPAGREHRTAQSRYGHEEGLLDRLGGGAWQAKKARLKERIREIAERLIRIAAERALRHAPVLRAAARRSGTRSARAFPMQETDDQLSAIEDVIADWNRAARWTG